MFFKTFPLPQIFARVRTLRIKGPASGAFQMSTSSPVPLQLAPGLSTTIEVSFRSKDLKDIHDRLVV